MARALADIERDISALSQKERTELLRKLHRVMRGAAG